MRVAKNATPLMKTEMSILFLEGLQMETKMELKIRKIGKVLLTNLMVLLAAFIVTIDVACVKKTMWYTSTGCWDFMRAAHKAADEVATDIEEVWEVVRRKIGIGPQWTESYPIVNANISWVALMDKGERRN